MLQGQIACRPILCCLLLSLLPLNALAGDSQAWNIHEYEYDLVESVLLIILVVFALAFEISWHHVVHEVAHSYHYGVEHDNFLYGPEDTDSDCSGHHPKDHHGNLIHVRLMKQLVTRMSGEFMTLGFLALMIFILNQTEFFNFVASQISSCDQEDSSRCWHVPRTGSDWLHMAEVVHVKLFLSMILYFCIISRVVVKSNNWIRNWEKLRLRRLMEGEWPQRPSDPDLQAYKDVREYLIQNVLVVKGHRTKLFNELVSKLDVDLKMLPKKIKIQRIREEVDDRLSLSSYLSYNVEKGVTDSIEVHVTTWVGIMGMFGIFAIFNRFVKVEMALIFPVFVVIGIMFFGFMIRINFLQRREIRRFITSQRDEEAGGEAVDHMLEVDPNEPQTPHAGHAGRDGRTWFQRSLKERHVMRGWQAVLFIMCYALAENLADKHKWLAVPVQTLVLTLVYLVLFLIMLFVIPGRIPRFLYLTALPPFVNRHNVAILLYVVLDDHSFRGMHDELRKKIMKASLKGLSSAAHEESFSSLDLPHEENQAGYRTALELADIISQCKNFEALANVKETLLQRLQADGSDLTEGSCSKRSQSTSFKLDSFPVGAKRQNGGFELEVI
mmetsp:Transcript_29483/g.52475  ORF Transcript_29483/g.52475 Transcript_29483/m.52475 type:complete len:610 (-) Transcript_29483:40-1869(-)